MAIVAKFGFRTYEFEHEIDLSVAQHLWVRTLSQDDFENKMEDEGIEFCYDFDSTCN